MSGTSQGLILVILGALLAIVLLGGPALASWRQLARIYPDRQFPVDASFRAVSGVVGGATRKRCLRVDVGEVGVRISTSPLFRNLQPPIVIPWSDITACLLERYYLSPEAARLDLERSPEPIYLWPTLWRDERLPCLLKDRWHEQKKRVA